MADTEYIITESQMQKLQELAEDSILADTIPKTNEIAENKVKLIKDIRSHLLSEAIRSEQKRVLDELDKWCTPEDNELDRPAKYKGDYVHASGRLRKKIESLRCKDRVES